MSDNTIKVYRLKELENILGLTRVTLLKYCNNGTIKANKIGNRWIITEENLQRYINGTN